MIKKIIIALLLLTSIALWSTGVKEVSIPIPEKAGWLFGADIKNLTDNSLFNSLFELYPFFPAYGLPNNVSLEEMNNELILNLGFGIKEVESFYMWGNDLDLPNRSSGYGYILKSKSARDLLSKIKVKRDHNVLEQKIISISIRSSKLYFIDIGPYLCFSERIEFIKMMSSSYTNNKTFKNNKELYPFFKQYSKNDIFFTAEIKSLSAEWLVSPLDLIDFGAISIDFQQQLKLKGEIIQKNEKQAKQFYNLFLLSLNLISQFVPSENEEIRQAYKYLMAELDIELDKNKVMVTAIYNKDVIQHIKNLINFSLSLLYERRF